MPAAKPVRVMLVDDHELVRRTLRDRLAMEGDIEVVATAASADEAVQGVQVCRPDVVLMDLDLAGVESLEATCHIASLLPNVRIVFLSAFSHDRYIDFAVTHGAHGYVTKRESLDTLIDAVRNVAAGKRFFSAEVRARLVRPPAPHGGVMRARLYTLTPRQREILVMIAQGRSKKAIAAELRVSVKTVEAHCETMMKRLQLNDRVELARFAIREGFVSA